MSIPREWTNLGARCDFPVARTEPKEAAGGPRGGRFGTNGAREEPETARTANNKRLVLGWEGRGRASVSFA